MDKMKGKINASIKYISNSVEETYALAKSIADKLKGGEVILLNGDCLLYTSPSPRDA